MYEYDAQQMMASDPYASYAGPSPDQGPPEQEETQHHQWDLDAEFEQLFRPQVPPEPPLEQVVAGPPRVDRRRRRTPMVRMRWPSVLGGGLAGITAVVTATVSVLGAMITYDPLRQLAFPTAHGLADLWPLLVYGPWFAACLSILHAAAHRRQARAAWIAVTLFSGVAVALCIAHAPRSATSIATAGLPPISALAGFHLLFRQITLLHPRHAKIPGQRRH